MTEEYWTERSSKSLITSENITNKNIPKVMDIYNEAFRNIDKQIKSIYDNYSKKGILDVSELKKTLDPKEKIEFVNNVRIKAKKLGIKSSDVYDEGYLLRLTRLQALREEIGLEILNIAPQTDSIYTLNFTNLINKTYNSMVKDLNTQGITTSFSTLNKPLMKVLLGSNWEGGNYSTRIWKNTGDFAKKLQVILGGALESGTSYQKTAKLLKDKFKVSKSDATRLIRTETNYFHNQTDIQSYVDNEIEEYDILTALEPCPICLEKAKGNPYKTSEMSVGLNCCPFHPNDRCTTVAHFEEKPKRQTPTFDDRTFRFDNNSVNVDYKKEIVSNYFA